MSEESKDNTQPEFSLDQLNAIRKEVGRKIDPETAQVYRGFAQALDPYGDGLDLPDGWQQVGREYFVRAPGSDIWIHFRDLPPETRERLWRMHRSKLAFPAGLPWAI